MSGKWHGGLAKILKDLEDKCVTFGLVSGREITGFVRDVKNGVVEVFAAGQTIFIVIAHIETFQVNEDAAC